MSAFVVSKLHIDGLIKAGLELTRPSERLRWHWDNPGRSAWLDVETADRVGQMLWDENLRSVNYRYTEQTEVPTYTYERLPGLVTVQQHLPVVFKMLHCYEYQSCEAPDWRKTQAYAFVRSFTDRLTSMIPGYDRAEGWELRNREVFGTERIVSITDLIAHNRRSAQR